VRLIDHADRSVVAVSPLLEASPTAEAPATTIWHSDFEGDILRDLDWPFWGRGVGAWTATDRENGQIVCLSGDRTEQFSILIPAEPLTQYRVTRRLRTDWVNLDLRVVESAATIPEGEVPRSDWARRRVIYDRIMGKASALAAHRFGGDGGAGWVETELAFTSNLGTRTIGIVFDRVGDASRPLEAEACLARLSVERLDPDPAQEVALLRSAWSTEADRGLGLVKRGRLLPLRRARVSKPPYDDNYEVRDALFAPAPTRLRFPMTLPDQPRLTFSYGLSSGSQIGDQVQFQVVVEHEGESTSVFQRQAEVGEQGEGWHWHDALVDLAAWSGEEVVLELRTRSATQRGFGLWANPMIDSPRRRGDPPNLVLIGIDTLRADRLSVYGHERPTSPNLDRLAGDGVRFARAISASNWTSPSFASMFTGLPASSHGVVNQEFSMNQSLETLAEGLQSAGWRTHAVVYKAALFGLGLDQGFDRWFNLPTSHRTAQNNLDKALAFLDTVDDRQFFLFFHLDDPHQPFNQPPPFDREFSNPEVWERLGLELPLSIRNGAVSGCESCIEEKRPTDEFVDVAQELYDGAVAYTDDRIGALIGELRRRGIYEDTVIVVVSDHGEVLFDRQRLWGHGALLMSDELVHVPLIIKPAGRSSHSGQVVDTQVRTTDLPPTLMEALGLAAEPGADSRSLWPLVEGDESADRVAFFENPQRNVMGLRTPNWKYVIRWVEDVPYRGLYDLQQDPGEKTSVAKARPQERARLDEMLARFMLRTRSGPFVLVVGDGAPGTFQLVIETAGEGGQRSLVGLPPRPETQSDDLEVAGGGRVLALVQLDLEPGQPIRASLMRAGQRVATVRGGSDDLSPYDPGAFDRLLESPGAYLLQGPDRVGSTRVGPPTQVDQVEDLRALGYIE